MNLYLRPSVILKSPYVKFKATEWSLYAEPGGMLNVPYQRVCIEKTQNPMLTDLHQHKQRPMACH